MYLPLTLWSLSALTHHAQTELLMLGLFYGALLIIMGYNLWLFLALNDFNYLYLGLFIAALSLGQGAIDGLTQQYLWTNWRNPFNYEFFGPLALVLGLQFTASFLETKRHIPKLHKTIHWLIGLTSLVFILNFFIACRSSRVFNWPSSSGSAANITGLRTPF